MYARRNLAHEADAGREALQFVNVVRQQRIRVDAERVSLDDGAPWAHIRRAIMTGGGGVPDAAE